MTLWVGCLSRDALEIYRLGSKETKLVASGSLADLQPLRGAFGRKVLIIGRDMLFHARKKYPPAPREKLLKAVSLDVGDLFPLENPAFHCAVFESFAAYTVMDIWAWETDSYTRLREIFPFSHVIPEDRSFIADTPEIKIFRRGQATNVVAVAGERFIAGASYPASGFGRADLEMFFKGLGSYGGEIKKITIHGDIPLALEKADLPPLARSADEKYPPCVASLNSRRLGEFKVGRYRQEWVNKELLLRLLIYLVLGWGFLQWRTLENYDRVLEKTRQQTAASQKQIAKIVAAPRGEDFSEVSRAVDGLLARRPSPLAVLNMLAQKLPAGSFVKRLVLSENHLEIVLSSKTPLEAVRIIAGVPQVSRVSLKGAPQKDQATGFYSAVIIIELAG